MDFHHRFRSKKHSLYFGFDACGNRREMQMTRSRITTRYVQCIPMNTYTLYMSSQLRLEIYRGRFYCLLLPSLDEIRLADFHRYSGSIVGGQNSLFYSALFFQRFFETTGKQNDPNCRCQFMCKKKMILGMGNITIHVNKLDLRERRSAEVRFYAYL